MTVLPNAVEAASTPVSCFSIAAAATVCSGRSSPCERDGQGPASMTLVATNRSNTQMPQHLTDIIQTTTRYCDVMRMLFSSQPYRSPLPGRNTSHP